MSLHATVGNMTENGKVLIIKERGIRMKRGEVYYIKGQRTSGSEIQKDRPGVIISNNMGNEHSPNVIVAYITSTPKNKLPVHVATQYGTVMTEQVFTVDKSRLGHKLGVIKDMRGIDNALYISLNLSFDAVLFEKKQALEERLAIVQEEEKQIKLELNNINTLCGILSPSAEPTPKPLNKPIIAKPVMETLVKPVPPRSEVAEELLVIFKEFNKIGISELRALTGYPRIAVSNGVMCLKGKDLVKPVEKGIYEYIGG